METKLQNQQDLAIPAVESKTSNLPVHTCPGKLTSFNHLLSRKKRLPTT